MNTHDTHVTVVLDRSGSMAAIAEQVIAGFNGFVADQAAQPGFCRLTLVQFDSEAPFDVVIDAIPVVEVGLLDLYDPRGGTPLYDAIGNSLTWMENRPHANQVMVIITDGLENSSTDWTRAQISERIQALQKKGWVFVFLAANQDAFAAGEQLGVARESTMNWSADAKGTTAMWNEVSAVTTGHRLPRRVRLQDRQPSSPSGER